MILMIIYTIFSFFLDGFVSNYQSIVLVQPSIFRTIYSVVSLVIIYEYFDNQSKYLYLVLGLGFLFDIVYTNTFILNIIIFLIISLILSKLDYLVPNNIFTINLKSIISIVIYHFVTYLVLLITNYNSYDIKLLLVIVLRSIIMTVIYTSISYIFIRKIYNKFYNKMIK